MLMWATPSWRDVKSGRVAGRPSLPRSAATSVADSGRGRRGRSMPHRRDLGRLPRRGEGRRGYLAGRRRADGTH